MTALPLQHLLILLLVPGGVAVGAGAGAPNQAITIIEKARSEWRIVAPPPGSPGVTRAAAELQRYLRQMTGCKLPIVRRSPKPALALGLRHELAPDDRALLSPIPAGYDGYAIAVQPATRKTPARIVIGADNGRGVLYGVYDLLEHCGCRWFYPALDPADPEVVPRAESLSLPAGGWAVASPVKYRICGSSQWGQGEDPVAAVREVDWALKNRFNVLGWQADSEPDLATQRRLLQTNGLLAALTDREMLLYGPGRDFNTLVMAWEWAQKQTQPGSGAGAVVRYYYADNSAQSWVMSPLTKQIEADRVSWRQAPCEAVYLVRWPGGCWWNHGLNACLAGHCFYDGSLRPSQLLQDYTSHYFGAEAGALLAPYFEEWARRPELGDRVRGQARESDCAALAEQRRRWLTPAVEAVKTNAALAHRLAKVEKLHTLAERSMEVHRQRGEIQALRRAGQFQQARACLATARAQAEQTLEFCRSLADLHEGLLDRQWFASQVSGNMKNCLDQEAEAIVEQRRD